MSVAQFLAGTSVRPDFELNGAPEKVPFCSGKYNLKGQK